MVRKLIQLDEESWGWTEIDPVKLRRVSLAFKAWLDNIDPKEDPFGFLKMDLPIVQSALDGTLMLPYKGKEPHSWEVRERTIPQDYLAISSPFYNTIRGAHLTPPKTIEQNGKRYAWADFEEE